MKHLFILNPVAGSKDRSRIIADAAEKLGLENTELYVTACAKDATREVQEQLENSAEHIRIYACGGDGTFNEVVTGIIRSGSKNCSVAVVPTGSGNDFIKALPEYTASDFRDLRRASKGETMPLDVMLVTDSESGTEYISVNVASAGFDSAVADGMGKYRRTLGGKGSYNMSLAECFLKYETYEYTIYCDDKDVFGGAKSCMFALAANGNYYGGAYKAAPLAEINDGYMDFICIDRVTRSKFLKLVGVYKRGEHLEKAKGVVTYRKCKKLKFVSPGRIPFNVDGEIILMKDPEIRLLEGAVNLVLPKAKTNG